MNSTATNQPRHAVLLVNLGSPTTCTTKDIRLFLGEFLTDPSVITLKNPWRTILFKGIVAPIRAKKVLEKYESIWHDSGISPLHFFTTEMQKKLQHQLGDDWVVLSAMRYQQPSIAKQMDFLTKMNLQSLTIVPLFPQSAKETTGSIEKMVATLTPKFTSLPKPNWINNYFDAPYFIDAMIELYKEKIATFSPDVILLSYHGLPNQSVEPFCTKACKEGGWQEVCHAKGDHLIGDKSCYRAQCYATSRAFKESLKLDAPIVTVFQSRFGPLKWIGPGLLAYLDKLIAKGYKKVAIACPSFMTDCLETLEEVNIAAREYWLEKGGEDLLFLPCINDNSVFVNGLYHQLVKSEGSSNE